MADGSTTIAGVTCGDASTTVVSSTNIGSVNIIYHTYTAIGNQVTEYITLSGTPVITGLFDVSVAPQFTPLTSQTFLGTGISTIVGSSSVSAIATTGASSSSIVCTCYGGVAGVTNVVSIVVQYKK